MGLCKCPKRKVTNQFCYEHRVNVCEYCMITNHPKCVVLSYLKWLQDGDYNPICELCTKKLSEDECVRLVCYHVFHWNCLDNYARQLPGTMAPAGYTCPSCHSSIFPPSNLVSPVADVLRKKFGTVNWARTGLGLPLLAEEEEMKRKTIQEHNRNRQTNSIYGSNQSETKSENTVVLIDGQSSSTVHNNGDVFENKFPDNVPRRLTHSSETKKLLPKFDDHDDNKYERKTMTEKFGRFQMYAKNSKYFQFYFRNKYRRMFAVAVVLFVGFFLFMLIIEKLGNRGDDPLLDPRNNPHIIVHDTD